MTLFRLFIIPALSLINSSCKSNTARINYNEFEIKFSAEKVISEQLKNEISKIKIDCVEFNHHIETVFHFLIKRGEANHPNAPHFRIDFDYSAVNLKNNSTIDLKILMGRRFRQRI